MNEDQTCYKKPEAEQGLQEYVDVGMRTWHCARHLYVIVVCYFFTVIKDEIVWYLINQRITLNILFMWHHRTTSRNEMEEATDIFTHIVAYIQVELIIIKNIY